MENGTSSGQYNKAYSSEISTKDMAIIPSELENLSKSLAVTENEITMLTDKLTSVLSPSDIMDRPIETPQPAISNVALTFQSLTRRIQELSDMVMRTRGRLEL